MGSLGLGHPQAITWKDLPSGPVGLTSEGNIMKVTVGSLGGGYCDTDFILIQQ